MTYAKKTLSEIKLIHGDYGNFIKGQKLPKDKEKKYKTPPYKDLAASNEIDGEPLDEKCWPGYEKKGMKTMFGKRYPNCVKKKKTRKEEFSDWRSELEQIEEKKMTKAQIKKRDEIADAISTREMNKRYGDKNVKYAIATKLAMKEDNIQEILDKKDVPHVKKLVKKLRDGSKTHAKQADDLEVALKTEDTAIESELVIQDWNVDDIKFTEIETVDIIKAKPLKENVDLYEGFKTRMIAKFGKKLLKNIGKVNPFTKTGAQRVTQGVGSGKKYIPPDKITSQNIQTKSVVNQAKKMVDMSKKPVKNIVELLSKENYQTGLIATSSITHATPAAFYAHVVSRDLEEEIAAQMATSSIDFFAGGGLKFFQNRKDGKNLLGLLEDNGFDIHTDAIDQKIDRSKRHAFLLGQEEMLKMIEELDLEFLAWETCLLRWESSMILMKH